MKIDTMENFDFNKLEIDHDEFLEYYKEEFKEKFHVNYKGGKPLVKIDGNLIFLHVPEDFDTPNENDPTGVSNFLIKVRDRLITEIFQPMIKSYSPQLQSCLNDGYYMHFVHNGGDIPVTRKDPEGNIKKVDFKKVYLRYPFKGSCVLEINDVAFHFYDSLKTYGYIHFKVKNLFLKEIFLEELFYSEKIDQSSDDSDGEN